MSTDSSYTVDSLSHAISGTKLFSRDHDPVVSGLTYLLNEIEPGEALVVTDSSSWPEIRKSTCGQSGHSVSEMLRTAAEADASALIVTSPAPAIDTSPIPIITVRDSRRALWHAAADARKNYTGMVIGVTGTVGKSTTKDLITRVVGTEFTTHKTPQNRNSIDGVSMTVSGLREKSDVAIIEAALSGFRSGRYNSGSLIAPNIAVITAIGVAHADMAATPEATAERKGRLIEHLQPGGTVIINGDTAAVEYLQDLARDAAAATILTFGRAEYADLRLLSWEPDETGSTVRADIRGSVLEYRIKSPGFGLSISSVTALGVAQLLGIDLGVAIEALSEHETAQHVTDVHTLRLPNGEALMIDDTKNAADLSMAAAFELAHRMSLTKSGRVVAVVGGIAHLGEHATRVHQDLAVPIQQSGIEHVFTYGDHMSGLTYELGASHIAHGTDPAQLAEQVWDYLEDGDVLVVKGSFRNTGFRTVPKKLIRLSADTKASADRSSRGSLQIPPWLRRAGRYIRTRL